MLRSLLLVVVPASFLSDMVDALAQWIDDIIDGIICALKRWWCWLRDFVMEGIERIVDWVLDELPEGTGDAMQMAWDFLVVIDNWVALREGAAFLAAFYGFMFIYVVVKIIRRFIPTLG